MTTYSYDQVHNFVNHQNTVYALVGNPDEENGLAIVSTVANKTKWRSLRTFNIPRFEMSAGMYTNGVVAYILSYEEDGYTMSKLYSINLVDASQPIVPITLPRQINNEDYHFSLDGLNFWIDETTEELYMVGAKALWRLSVGQPGSNWEIIRNFSHDVNFITANQDVLILANIIKDSIHEELPVKPAMYAIQFDKLPILNNNFETIELKSPYVFDINIIENTIVVIYAKENKDDNSNNIVIYTYDKAETTLDIHETGKYYIDGLALDTDQIYSAASADILKKDKLLTIGLVKTTPVDEGAPISLYFMSVQLDENGTVSNPISSTVETGGYRFISLTQFSYTSTSGVCFAISASQDFYRSTDLGKTWKPENIVTI